MNECEKTPFPNTVETVFLCRGGWVARGGLSVGTTSGVYRRLLCISEQFGTRSGSLVQKDHRTYAAGRVCFLHLCLRPRPLLCTSLCWFPLTVFFLGYLILNFLALFLQTFAALVAAACLHRRLRRRLCCCGPACHPRALCAAAAEYIVEAGRLAAAALTAATDPRRRGVAAGTATAGATADRAAATAPSPATSGGGGGGMSPAGSAGSPLGRRRWQKRRRLPSGASSPMSPLVCCLVLSSGFQSYREKRGWV